ncbi:DUF1684 domain-containing protein [Bacteroidota bacterium]
MKLFSKKHRWGLTLFSWIILLVIFFLFVFIYIKKINSFLSVNNKEDAKILVIEGWIPDYAISEAIIEFKTHSYQKIFTVGSTLMAGSHLSGFHTHAEVAYKTILKLGFEKDKIVMVPSAHFTKDRTYASALALKRYFKAMDITVNSINMVTLGCHARRSRLLFKKAFGKDFNVGVISVNDESFDPGTWWKSSNGVREIIDETIAYIYAWIFFKPPKENNHNSEAVYLKEIIQYRALLDRNYLDTAKTPLDPEQLAKFDGLSWFPINFHLRIKGKYSPNTEQDTILFKTSTENKRFYIKTGKISFRISNNTYELFTYQNVNSSTNPGHQNNLFCPFTDLTSGVTTYGGGRYLDLTIPKGDSLNIDFNMCYHPYCAYNHKWSCVIPPSENHLPIDIIAGIRM